MELLALAVAPGIFWLWYFRTRDRLRPEPRRLVGWTFAAGVLAALAAALIEAGAFRMLRLRAEGLFIPSAIGAAVLIGAVEETTKFLAVLLAVYRRAEFDEVMDGILYAVVASLGFATIENVAYVLQGGYGVGILRALLSVPGHAFFGAVLGFYMGVAKFAGPATGRWFAIGLALAIAAHAAYDAAVFTGTILTLLVIPFILLLWRASLAYVRRALALDDARLGRTLAVARRLS